VVRFWFPYPKVWQRDCGRHDKDGAMKLLPSMMIVWATLSTPVLGFEKEDLLTRYRNKFVVVMREGLAIGVCEGHLRVGYSENRYRRRRSQWTGTKPTCGVTISSRRAVAEG
jgi:hypothetical protein